jgi:hypothetical protein
MFALNSIDRALSMTAKMLNARASLQVLLGNGYQSFVKGWVALIRERKRERGCSPIEIMCDLAEKERDQMLLLAMLAATLEVVEEEARKAGAI